MISVGVAIYKIGHLKANVVKILIPILKIDKFLTFVSILGAFIETCSAILAVDTVLSIKSFAVDIIFSEKL